MFTLIAVAPAALALLATLVAYLVSRGTPGGDTYTPDFDHVDAWRAALDVDLGDAWFQDATPVPSELEMQVPCRVHVRTWITTPPHRTPMHPTSRHLHAHRARVMPPTCHDSVVGIGFA